MSGALRDIGKVAGTVASIAGAITGNPFLIAASEPDLASFQKIGVTDDIIERAMRKAQRQTMER